nr:retrotransposon protein [Tanacetum cinerariifolium]
MVIKSLESLCANLFWGSHESSKKLSWVKWSNTLASFDKGGLGVGSLSAFNKAFLRKWRWPLFNFPNSLWVQVIKAFHGNEAGMDLGGYQTSGTWAKIVGTINHLHSSGIVPLNSIRFKVGDGSSSCFWPITMGRSKTEFDNLIIDISNMEINDLVESDTYALIRFLEWFVMGMLNRMTTSFSLVTRLLQFGILFDHGLICLFQAFSRVKIGLTGLIHGMFLRTTRAKRVKRLEKKRKSRPLQLKRRLFKVRIESSTKKSLGDQEDASNQGRNMAGFTYNQLKNKSFKEVQKAFDNTMTWINSFVSMNTEVVKDRAEGNETRVEAKVDNDQEEAEIKMYMNIVSDDEVAVDVIPLATKPPIIVDCKIIKEGKISSYHIIRADGSSKRYSSMIQMLQNIDREDLETLWKRLGYVNMRLIQSLASKELVRNLPKLKYDQHFYDACKMGKQDHANHKAKNIVSTTGCLELLHIDLFGPSTTRSYRGNQYTLVIVDDYSREFDNEVQFGEFCNANGITHNFSAPRTPQSNGVVERKNMIVQEMSRTMLNEKSLP